MLLENSQCINPQVSELGFFCQERTVLPGFLDEREMCLGWNKSPR